ncbi:MAG: anaerobic ribonucleoside-triphosphate reductase activating protein [Candidatus Marinimicrobia bacterium]|nr:anaerobic ribonucleoside-triphosphate reductase activating protein [Candidatus Neomarinimicrobiota bacterium]
MRIGGFQKFSMSDFPDKISAILFTTGCNFRCPYCHNPELVLPEKYRSDINIGEIFSFLEDRIGKLDGVVITGGEPTLHDDLPDLIENIKEMNYAVKLDTNGTNPEMIYELLQKELVDYIAMDYKAPLEKYSQVCGINNDYNHYLEKIQETLILLITSNIDYEIRTTVAPQILDKNDIQQIREEIGQVKKHYLQNLESGNTLDPQFCNNSSEKLDLKKLAVGMRNVYVR